MSGAKAKPNFAPGGRVVVVVGTRRRGPWLFPGGVAEVFPLAITKAAAMTTAA